MSSVYTKRCMDNIHLCDIMCDHVNLKLSGKSVKCASGGLMTNKIQLVPRGHTKIH